ncbi:MAG: glutathione-regulated potassium-efflux system ancillary protein KefG [bacterium]|nr:glutathione-regulated potassium-efflux system ancillary protein KefG [bacterium]
MADKKILINIFHPRMEQSRGNKAMMDAAKELPNVTVRNLYEEYPDFKIDVAKEQKLLLENDVIVFQHPLFWLSSPALLKEWQDTVLEKGFAFPPGQGDKLAGKIWQTAVTAGGPTEGYTKEGPFQADFEDILIPFRLTATYSSMQWQPAFAICSVMAEDDQWMRAITAEELDAEAARYKALLQSF